MILILTGGFGCGKSLAASVFASRGFAVADADALCHSIYPDCTAELRAAFGDGIFTASGGVDRAALARLVFAGADAMERLCNILYPRLGAELRRLIGGWRASGRDAVIEIPLWFEAGEKLGISADATVAVYTDADIRRSRLISGRGFSEEEIMRREKFQQSAEAKLEQADYGLINSGNRGVLERQIDLLIANFEVKNGVIQ